MSEKWERWNKKEILILKKHYSLMPRNELMQLLPGRTWRGIGHAAEKQELHRNWCEIPLSKEEITALHTRLSIARGKRTDAPFAGNHHTADARLAISVSNLYTRGHSIADIARRNGITKKKVKEIIEKKKKK